MTQIGALDKRIVLQYQTKVPDGMGGFTTVYATACTIFAAIWPTSASEQVKANAVTMVATHRVRIRFRSVIKASWRILFGTRYFSIVSIINPSESNEWLDLLCKEVVA